jgi:hypothetical protein
LCIGLTTAQTITEDGVAVCQPNDKDVLLNFYLTMLNIGCLSLLCLVLIINIYKKLNANPKPINQRSESFDSFDQAMYAKSQTRSIYPTSEGVEYSSGSIGRPMVSPYDALHQPPSFERGISTYSPTMRSHQALPVMYEDEANIDPFATGTLSRNFSQSVDPMYEVPRASRKTSVPNMPLPMYGNLS